jgi:serine/threonine protein kinase
MFEEGKTYNGIDADIFSLGVLLYQLVTSGRGFLNVNRNSYQNIKDKKYEKYWEKNFRSEELSDEFKKLFIRMVAYEPSERPRIKDILKDSWFEEINNLLKNNKEEYEKLEQKYIQYMKKIEDKIHNQNEDIIEIKPKNEENQEKGAIKGISFDDKEQIFDESMEPKKLKENKKLKYFLKIKGYINPVNFMSSLFYKIIQNYDKDEIYLEASKTKLAFKIIFENEDGEEGVMKIKLYESEYNEYILSFNKTKGNIEIFYDNFLKIKEIIKKKLLLIEVN